MLKAIKLSLRITHNMLDTEIQDTIDAAKKDLCISGVERIEDKDVLILKACKCYARAEYDFNGKGEQYRESYNMLKEHLALCGDYKAVSG